MMLIPPPVTFVTTDCNSASAKDNCFTSPGRFANGTVPSIHGGSERFSECGRNEGQLHGTPKDTRMLASSGQRDSPCYRMHAAIATSHSGGYLNSPSGFPVGAGHLPAHFGPSAMDPASYYASLESGYNIKRGDMWNGGYNQHTHHYYQQYETGFGYQYPYDRCYAPDMNDGARRKTATRESTNALKGWLQEHKKNPYPTKGEKIMLAIVTKMTLTQVSTWFANARRRLKKENKMTWVPKNRASESGTDDTRQSDDNKDSDEKSDEENCVSDKEEDIDQGSVRLDADSKAHSSRPRSQQGPSLPPQNAAELRRPFGSESLYSKAEDVQTMDSNMPRTSDANSIVAGKIKNATNTMQNELTSMNYAPVLSDYSKPIWSPMDSQKHSATHHPDLYSNGSHQTGYHLDPIARRLSSSHAQAYGGDHNSMPLRHRAPAPHHSHENQTLHDLSSNPRTGVKMFSSVPLNNGNTGLTERDPMGLSENTYRFPVADSRNCANGMLRGSYQGQFQDKNIATSGPSPNSRGGTVMLPGAVITHYARRRYDQNYSHLPAYSAGSDAHMLHRSMNVPDDPYYSYGASRYRSESAGESGSAYYNHHPKRAVGKSTSGDSIPLDNPHVRDAFSSFKQLQCRGSPSVNTATDHRPSEFAAYHENPPLDSVPRSCALPNHCALFTLPRSQDMSAQPHRSNCDVASPRSNHLTSQSPRSLQTGIPSREGDDTVCGIASDDEKRRAMLSAGTTKTSESG